ncbi:hypothetical protein J6U32_20480 [Gordonia polyisoprenivorans]|nr:hypothetical protein J6U32_20480 [Gordonia polyisoprenivorans]
MGPGDQMVGMNTSDTGDSLSSEIAALATDAARLAEQLGAASESGDALRLQMADDAIRRARRDLTVADAALAASPARAGGRRETVRLVVNAARVLLRRTTDEVARALRTRPHAVLIRVVITLAISLSLVVVYRSVGWATYEKAGSLTLYVFGGVVGSVVCTNALCFDAARVWTDIRAGERLWRILVAKNLMIVIGVAIAAVPILAYLAVTTDLDLAAMIDQFVVMVLVWLGVGNVLSVVAPLRHESLSARLRDGTWRPYLVSFGISYVVGLTVNLMIYWRLWARQLASESLTAPSWTLQLLLLASGALLWISLTVIAVSVAGLAPVRVMLLREVLATPAADQVRAGADRRTKAVAASTTTSSSDPR